MNLQKQIPSGLLKLVIPKFTTTNKDRFFCIPSRFATQLNFRKDKLIQTVNYFSRVPNSKLFVFCPEDEYTGYQQIIKTTQNTTVIPYHVDFEKPKDYNIGDARNIILRFSEYLNSEHNVQTVCVVDDDITKLQNYPSKIDVQIEDASFWKGVEEDMVKNNYIVYSFVNSSSVRALKLPQDGRLSDSFFEADRLFPSGMVFLNLNMWMKNQVFYPPCRYLEDIIFAYRCSQHGRVMVTRKVIKTHGNSTAAKSTTRNKDNKDLTTYTDYDKELHMEMVEDAISKGILQFGSSTFYAKFYHDLSENRWINMKGLGYTYFTTIMRAFIEDKNIKKYPHIVKKKMFFQTV